MEKYSQDKETLTQNLRDEEAQLMQEMSRHMMTPEKTAAEAQRMSQTESRLQAVRAKITELDLQKP